MSESDSDYCDVGNSVDEGDNDVRNGLRKARTNEEGVKVRGTDVEWVEVVTFKNKEAFDESDIKATLINNFQGEKEELLTMEMLIILFPSIPGRLVS